MALTVGVNLGLFALMAKDGGSSKKVADLASALGVDPTLLSKSSNRLCANPSILRGIALIDRQVD